MVTATSLSFTPRRILPPIHSQTSTPATTNSLPSTAKDNDDISYDDESTLPRHVQIELRNNRKKIIDLEEQLKELKKLSIRKKRLQTWLDETTLFIDLF